MNRAKLDSKGNNATKKDGTLKLAPTLTTTEYREGSFFSAHLMPSHSFCIVMQLKSFSTGMENTQVHSIRVQASVSYTGQCHTVAKSKD